MFDGESFDPGLDRARLSGQLERVKNLMLDGAWRDLPSISAAVRGSEAGVSARLRDLRKRRFGAYVVERRHVSGGLFHYRVLPPIRSGQACLALEPHQPRGCR
jgi:hypothetical protein